ncbi:endo-1,4-beta-xylanase 5-like [Dioscorea cayenensis subsp. rotundata]|uniref:Endo-1,4-beta-xylanase 5-like n=1 Tax=Dioscorea cayennensis subsp. rotundata TaxID=55577 RepID=A0AB40CKS5_DIOCR|nr:endo-1,4-beta-xylanase 5-like [Dioscorea cayenensis subsp. rotundata]
MSAGLQSNIHIGRVRAHCKSHPEEPLYNGGILKNDVGEVNFGYHTKETVSNSCSFLLENLTPKTRYTFSCWVKLKGKSLSSFVKATLSTVDSKLECIGNVVARSDCWSFLKGGFVLGSPSNKSILSFQSAQNNLTEIMIKSASLQPFTVEQWAIHQQDSIQLKRKRMATIHVSDRKGNRIKGASILVQQHSKDFPFGSAIANTILGNSVYQKWYIKRFNATVFENELKWYSTEPEQGKHNYTLADQLLKFVRSNRIVARGHNIFWENPIYNPKWVLNLTNQELKSAVESRIQSLMSRYKGEFVHWDVDNERLHFDFYEQRLGSKASLSFFQTAQKEDPLATLFLNDYNVVETCDDVNSSVDSYILRLRELMQGGAILEGIGLEGHFTRPNNPFMRAVLDKLATLNLPIWLTELDISKKMDQQTQAIYLEEVLREGFSHPSISGIMLWTPLHPFGCYQMCLTDNNFKNLPTGDVVDKLLHEWQTSQTGGVTNEHGLYNFNGFLGKYKMSVSFGNKSKITTFCLDQGQETKHINIQLY